MKPVAGVLLAAGEGRRFGMPKALVPAAGRLLVEHGAELLHAAGCAPVIVVLGAAADEVCARADLAGCEVVVNADWPSGMGSSLRCGLSAAGRSNARAALVALVDQPGIGGQVLARLRHAWESGAVAAVASYDGQPRNPVLLDRSIWGQVVVDAVGDVGARAWLREHPDRVTLVEAADLASPADIDTPADLPPWRDRPAIVPSSVT